MPLLNCYNFAKNILGLNLKPPIKTIKAKKETGAKNVKNKKT